MYMNQGQNYYCGNFIDAIITYPGTDFSLYLNLKSLNSDVQEFLTTVAATIEPIYAQQ